MNSHKQVKDSKEEHLYQNRKETNKTFNILK
jgi:hypothetical protein